MCQLNPGETYLQKKFHPLAQTLTRQELYINQPGDHIYWKFWIRRRELNKVRDYRTLKEKKLGNSRRPQPGYNYTSTSQGAIYILNFFGSSFKKISYADLVMNYNQLSTILVWICVIFLNINHIIRTSTDKGSHTPKNLVGKEYVRSTALQPMWHY